jgi:hypothetical protein
MTKKIKNVAIGAKYFLINLFFIFNR